MSTMEQWDNNTRLCLTFIGSHAGWVAHHVKHISYAMALLKAKPGFNSGNIADLRAARSELQSAIREIDAQLAAYDAKPVETRRAA